MFTPRRRKYSNYRYRTQKYFAPTISKAPVPNYYQKKGRILQTSPLRIYDEDTVLITQKILDKYYNTLVKYHYPGLSPSPSIDPTQYIYNFDVYNISLSSLPGQINNQYLESNYVNQKISTLPPAPSGYSYAWDLIGIIFQRNASELLDTSRYSFSWNTPLVSSPVAIISKTLDTTYNSNSTALIMCLPFSATYCQVGQVTFTNAGITFRYRTQVTNDSTVTDDGIYPLLSNNSNSETYNSTIDILKETNSPLVLVNYKFTIYLISNDF